MPELLETGKRDVAVGDLHPHRLHRAAPAGELDRELMESIRELGILTRLVVRTDGTILAGKRRWEAAKALGLATLPCDVLAVTDDDLIAAVNSTPVFKIPTRPVEYARQLRRLLDTGEIDVPALAAKLGKSPNWVRFRLSLLDLVPEVATAVDADDSPLSLATAFKIARLPEEDQVAALGVVLALRENDTKKRAD